MDANPRVVYESVLAGLPVFVSEESRVPRIFRAQQFVFPTKRDSIKPNLNNDFKKFMEYVKSASRYEMSQRMDEFVSREMLEHRALSKICARLGICDEELLHR